MDFSSLIVHHLADVPLWGRGPFAFTKHMLMIALSGAIVFSTAVLAVRGGRAARGVRAVCEALAEFLWKDVVHPAMGESGRRFLPYFLTLFSFILVMNLLGLVPYGASATGNISVTAALSLTTFTMIHWTGFREHGVLSHFRNMIPHGVPAPLKPFIFLLEFSGYFTKSLALCVRLFANMTAGHIVILVFLGLILLFGQARAATGLAAAPLLIPLTVAICLLEIVVSFVQAYVFTMLTAIFVGGAVHPEH
jgi:F-type H+-transporting ATPase subunit a